MPHLVEVTNVAPTTSSQTVTGEPAARSRSRVWLESEIPFSLRINDSFRPICDSISGNSLVRIGFIVPSNLERPLIRDCVQAKCERHGLTKADKSSCAAPSLSSQRVLGLAGPVKARHFFRNTDFLGLRVEGSSEERSITVENSGY